MIAHITDMHDKEVINISDGMRLGFVDDVEVDTCTAQVVSIVIFGKGKCFGLLGREKDIVINWKQIEVIGEETVLVNFNCPGACPCPPKKGPQILGGLFR